MSALRDPSGRDGPVLGLPTIHHRLPDLSAFPSLGRGERGLLRSRPCVVRRCWVTRSGLLGRRARRRARRRRRSPRRAAPGWPAHDGDARATSIDFVEVDAGPRRTRRVDRRASRPAPRRRPAAAALARAGAADRARRAGAGASGTTRSPRPRPRPGPRAAGGQSAGGGVGVGVGAGSASASGWAWASGSGWASGVGVGRRGRRRRRGRRGGRARRRLRALRDHVVDRRLLRDDRGPAPGLWLTTLPSGIVTSNASVRVPTRSPATLSALMASARAGCGCRAPASCRRPPRRSG